jgi:hypothetical protein
VRDIRRQNLEGSAEDGQKNLSLTAENNNYQKDVETMRNEYFQAIKYFENLENEECLFYIEELTK